VEIYICPLYVFVTWCLDVAEIFAFLYRPGAGIAQSVKPLATGWTIEGSEF
jgi:hypothetical protein